MSSDELEYEDIYAALSRPAWQDAAQMPRRRFLQGALALGATVAVAGCVNGDDPVPDPIGENDGVLIVILLGGGNDGLNTLVPVGDPEYGRLRPGIGIAADQVLPVADGLGLHPSLRTIKARYDQGKVAIVRGVGQPKTDLSHFSSMATWMAGTASNSRATGWLGRWLDTLPDAADGLRGVAIGSSVPLHMVGTKSQITAMPTNSEIFGSDRTEKWEAALFDTIGQFSAEGSGRSLSSGPWAGAVATAGWRSMQRAAEMAPHYQPPLPEGDLVKQLTLAARLINANVGIRVFTASLGSFDTHSGQPAEHAALLAELDAGIDAFYRSLYPSFSRRVALMTFSEFGRRPQQNASQGTDHGDASVQFVIGDNVRGGLHGDQPSLTDVDERGDLKINVDFRSVYQSMLGEWLGADAKSVLGAAYPAVDLFRSGPGEEPVDPDSPWFPFASSKALVAQQYLDFMGRIGDQEGIDYWADLLEKKAVSVEGVIELFYASAEFGEAVSPAVRLGLAGTGAPTSFSSTVQWAAMVRAGTPLIDIARQVTALKPFAEKYGGLDNTAFLDTLHRDVLGRAPATSWTDTWNAKLTTGEADRAAVVLDLAEGPDNVVRARPPVEVTMTYVGMLRREPEKEGFDYWVDQVRKGISISTLARLFFETPEYRERFS